MVLSEQDSRLIRHPAGRYLYLPAPLVSARPGHTQPLRRDEVRRAATPLVPSELSEQMEPDGQSPPEWPNVAFCLFHFKAT